MAKDQPRDRHCLGGQREGGGTFSSKQRPEAGGGALGRHSDIIKRVLGFVHWAHATRQ